MTIRLQYDSSLQRLVTQGPFVTFEITGADFLVCSSFLLFLLLTSLFSVNLNETRHTALLESSYDDFPTHGKIFTPCRRRNLILRP